MFNQGGLLVKKKEMTRVMVDNVLTPVTVVEVLSQQVVRHKTEEKDGYTALVVAVMNTKGRQLRLKEFNINPDALESFPVGHVFTSELFEADKKVAVQGVSKGKGYAGPIKRHGAAGLPATHGHKFTRTSGSKGNRKPARGYKGYPHAGRMGTDTITLKNIAILQKLSFENKELLILKGSLPGSYNSYLSVYK